MSLQSSRATWIRVLVVFISALLGCNAGRARDADSPTTSAATDALEVLADLTMIDGTCRDLVVNFGIGFRFAAAQGVAATAILPGGARRAEFEAVLQNRQGNFGRDDLCGRMAQNYAEALPGSVTTGYYRSADGKP
ncbi:hypothetical protein [Lichenifustis flavocetrariae]|uniref:Lipoprotein n=1 Tax=Lichenifustis flavocetrariae TaxID=2949735 RepID=A0AA42CM50_9HYPH|nr:hypothetical protein [Lichenifustis flavocetrariae]MCW6508042.1 hypothetical protein [Lichenifustis flavocetrariae]